MGSKAKSSQRRVCMFCGDVGSFSFDNVLFCHWHFRMFWMALSQPWLA